ncbi:MAG: glycosyltransferase family 39 protein [Acidimicrobiales bacterium]
MVAPAPLSAASRLRPWVHLDRWQRRLVVVAAAGFVLRLGWVLFAARTPLYGHDPYFYLTYAERLADGHGYTTPDGAATAYYPVGYPAMLGGTLWLVRLLPGNHVLVAALGLNLLAGTTTILVIGLVATRAVGPRAGLGAACIVAFLPNFVFHTAAVLSETTFNALLATTLLVLCWRAWDEPWSLWRVVGAGALLGGAGLVRPLGLVVAPVLVAAWWFAARRDRQDVLKRTVVLVGVLALILGPWALRNQSALGRLTLSTNTGDNLCIGNNPEAVGGFNLAPYCFAEEPRQPFLTGGDGRDQRMTRRAVEWASAHLSAQPALLLWRTQATFLDDHDGLRAVQSYDDDPWLQPRHEALLANVADAAYFAVLGLAAIGIGRFARRAEREPRRTFVVVVAVALVVAVWPFFGDPRFHLPVMLVLCVPAGHALAVVLERRTPADLAA